MAHRRFAKGSLRGLRLQGCLRSRLFTHWTHTRWVTYTLIVGGGVRCEKCNLETHLLIFCKMLVVTTALSLQRRSSCFQTPAALGSQGCRVSSSHSPSWHQSSHRVHLASPGGINSASFNVHEGGTRVSAMLLQYHLWPRVAAQSTRPLKRYFYIYSLNT